MCVALPGRVVWKGEATAASIPGRMTHGSEERPVDLVMVPDAGVGDYVIAHSGYAIEVVPAERARETMRLLGVEP